MGTYYKGGGITMEREIRTIFEIEQALERIAKIAYRVCVTCEETIHDKRLLAIPWTLLCANCAGGGIDRNFGFHLADRF
jgi:RNA polymerase-binding transcription factor DksA